MLYGILTEFQFEHDQENHHHQNDDRRLLTVLLQLSEPLGVGIKPRTRIAPEIDQIHQQE